MDRLKIRHLAVRDERERLAGIVSARDLLAPARRRGHRSRRSHQASREHARRWRSAWATLPAVARALVRGGHRRAPRRRHRQRGTSRHDAARRRSWPRSRCATTAAARRPAPTRCWCWAPAGAARACSPPTRTTPSSSRDGDPDGAGGPLVRRPRRRASPTRSTPPASPIARAASWRRTRPGAARSPPGSDRIEHWVERARPRGPAQRRHLLRPAAGARRPGAGRRRSSTTPSPRPPADRPSPSCSASSSSTGRAPSPCSAAFGPTAGRIDLKLHGLFPIVTAARTLAIRHDIRRRSTTRRLEGLIERGVGNAEEMQASSPPTACSSR